MRLEVKIISLNNIKHKIIVGLNGKFKKISVQRCSFFHFSIFSSKCLKNYTVKLTDSLF